GTPNVSTDPLGHTTTNFYGNGFQSGTNFLGGYVTQVQNALLQNAYFDYDLGSGLLTTAKDVNGKLTSRDYDLYNRMLHQHNPDNGGTTLTYNDAQPPTVTASTIIDPSLPQPNRVEEGDLDGVGRVLHTRLLSDPEGVDTTDTIYDPNG